ncbi:MAG: hypothetical protein ACRDIC_05995 [bacterium]
MVDVLVNSGEDWAAQRLAGSGALSGNNGSHGAFGTDGTAAAKGDTALGLEVESRGATTVSVIGSGATAKYQAVWTNTATAIRAIQEAGLFSAAAAGTMFTSHNFTVINLNSGDSIQFTLTIDPA